MWESRREAGTLERQRDAYKLACEKAGVCMTCVLQPPEPYGCSDCMNTGFVQGDPYERIKQLEARLGPFTTELGPDGKEWAKTMGGYHHVDAVKAKADGFHGTAPWFHGWAVRQAFVAGAEWQEQRKRDG
ncbi:hypothetical protein [Mesorhizobium sp. M0843]|uniref:hypothetical protein n=1 Tax=Mesorhizobium sp. M0843 TaxID=2957010 RepID=UPI00333B72B7